MKALISSAVVGTIALALGMPGGEAGAQSLATGRGMDVLACYQWDIFPNERYKLNIKFHSPLSEKAEVEQFGHPPQASFSVHGKHVGVCGKKSQPDQFGATSTVRPVVGTLISVLPLGKPGGARLGLETFDTTGVVGAPIPINWCKDVEISCKALDEGFPPRVWRCFSQNKHPVDHRPSFLRLVDEANDPLCSQFEDGATAAGVEQGERPDTDCFVPQFDDPADSLELAGSGCTTPQSSIGPNE